MAEEQSEEQENVAQDRRDRERHTIPGLGMVLYHAAASRGTAQAINVSVGGILLESEHPWPPVGSEVELSFSFEEHGLIFSVPGRIARLEGKRAGIQFKEESKQLQRVIEEALGA